MHCICPSKHCPYILIMIWDKLEPYLIYPPIFTVNNSQLKRAMYVPLRTMDTFPLVDAPVVLYLTGRAGCHALCCIPVKQH